LRHGKWNRGCWIPPLDIGMSDETIRQYLTIRETAELLRVKDDYVRRLISNGHLVAYKLPGGPKARLRILGESVQRMMDNAQIIVSASAPVRPTVSKAARDLNAEAIAYLGL